MRAQDRTHCKHGHEFTPENTYRNKHGHRSCRKCRADANRRNARTVEYRRRSRAQNYQAKQAHIAAFKVSRGCLHCGEDDPVVLDCHHRVPAEKHLRVSYATTNRKMLADLGWQALKEELLKCDVLCANCHRREEHRLRQLKKAV